jgi:branched-chain amino acid transport system permease protein
VIAPTHAVDIKPSRFGRARRRLVAVGRRVVAWCRTAWAVANEVRRNAYVRLFVASMLTGLILAVMTGPEGSAAAPTSGITGSLSTPRVYWFLGFGALLFVLRAGWTRFGPAITAWSRAGKGRIANVLEATPRRAAAELALIGFGFAYVSWISPHDTWKGGLCIQLGAALLVLEAVTLAVRHGRRRLARFLAYGAVTLYGLLAWLSGPVSRYLNTIGAVPHNPVLGKTLMAASGFVVVVELLVMALGTLRARAVTRRGRSILVGVGIALVVYGFFMWTSWVQWNPNTPKSLARFLSRDHLLVHSNVAGLVCMAVGAALVVAALGWLASDARGTATSTGVGVAERYRTADLARGRVGRPALLIFVLLVALEWPLHMSTASLTNLNLQIMPYVLLGLGLNVVIGWAGLLDLGYIAFYAIGAYTTAYFAGALPVHPPFVLSDLWIIPLAILAAMLSGVLLGTPTLRLRGDYLAIVTLGFGEIVYICAVNLIGITGGAQGVTPPPGIPYLNFHVLTPILNATQNWNAITYLQSYYLLLGVVVVSMVAFNFLNHSRVGRSWTALREDEPAADSIGINALKYKVMAFAIGASTGGFAGVFLASESQSLFPSSFTVQFSITVVVVVVFGGMGSLAGPVIGAIVIQGLPLYLTQQNYTWYDSLDLYIYLGAILIVMMIFRPQGVIPSRRRRREIQLVEHGAGPVDDTTAETATVSWRTRVFGSGYFLGERGYLSAEDR